MKLEDAGTERMASDSPGPLLPEVGILGLVPDRWGDVWMPRHHIMTRLARYFQVLWLDPARGWRAALRGVSGDRSDLNPRLPAFPGFRRWKASSLTPIVYRPAFIGDFIRRVRLRAAAGRLRTMGARSVVLYLWRPEFEYALETIAHVASCYHVDDEYSFSTDELPTSQQERQVLERVDHVFIHSPGLWEKKAPLAKRPVPVPNGVDYAAYSKPEREPADLANIARPRVGYIGVVKRFLDLPLLLAIAKQRPRLSFVFVGPVKPLREDEAILGEIADLPNVHMLGARAVEDLPAYAQHLDVGIMPYAPSGYTKFIFPMKLHEYLAAGIPVVGASIPTLRAFEGVISIADGPDEWCAAIDKAAAEASRQESLGRERRSVARAFDWDVLAHRVAMTIATSLGPRELEVVSSVDLPQDFAWADKVVTGRVLGEFRPKS